MKTKDTVAVVLGGARGIGRACVERLLAEGAKVCVADIQDDLGRSLCSELSQTYPRNVVFVRCDITNDDDVNAVFAAASEKFSASVEIFVNSAAIQKEDDWRKTITVNLFGTIGSTYVAKQWMGTDSENGRGGVIIHMASILGLMPCSAIPAYSASKHAIIGFVKSMADPEFHKVNNVRINCICPNLVDTPLVNDVVAFDMGAWARALDYFKEFVLPIASCTDAMMLLIEEERHNGTVLYFPAGHKAAAYDHQGITDQLCADITGNPNP